MYNILLSKIEYSFPILENRLKEIIKNNYKIAILPWAFPDEIDGDKLINDY